MSSSGGGYGPTTSVDATRKGSIIYDSTNKVIKYCNGTAWVVFSTCESIPTGTIMAFALASCPAGWTEYTAARGRFLRGIDNGAGVDPAGTRAPGNTQADDFGSHGHSTTFYQSGDETTGRGLTTAQNGFRDRIYVWATGGTPMTTGAYGGITETRPENVAVTFCQKT